MRMLFVVNPVSGGKNKESFLQKADALFNKYGVDHEIFKTTGDDDKEKLLVAIESYKPNKIIAVGGDGTTQLTATALLNTKIPFGIIPLGSANGMAMELSVNPDPIDALTDILMSELVVSLDIIHINEKYYSLHIGDVGINARIVKAYNKDENRGMATYARYFINELNGLEPFKVKVYTADKVYEECCLMLGICNARKYGTGIPLNLSGNPMDGKFELVLIQNLDINVLIMAGLSKFDENFYDSQTSKVIQAEEADIEFYQPQLLQLDGEVIGEFEKLNIKMIKGAVQFITHRENQYLNN